MRTLGNAITQDKVHHAYLFVGSRGTGKTSMAKILASCLNCERGPTVEPCGVCASCVGIRNATSLDVIEMDAASHNKVEDVRDLRDGVAFAPVSGRAKVYILDEAHMLTGPAWNALLKTLEEPPPGTHFVLATTEAHQVPATVVDRCHRFDFTRPTVDQLASVLRRVAGQEGIEIAPDALALLARHATGSFRDALGTLEQLVTYSDGAIATADVVAVLGAVEDDLLFGAIDAVVSHDAAGALRAAASLADTGRDLQTALRDLEVHARELLIVRALGEVPADVRVTPERDARLSAQAQVVTETDLVRLLDLLGGAMRAVRDGADARTQLELALVRAATPEIDASAKALLARIARLEAALQGGVPAAAAATPAPAPAVAAPVAAVAAAPGAAAAPALPEPAPVADVEPEPQAAAEPDVTATRDPRSVTLAEVVEIWPAVLQTVSEDFQLLGAALGNARPAELNDGVLVVAFAEDDSFNHRLAAESTDNRRVLGEALQALTGARLRLDYALRALDGHVVASAELQDDALVAHLVEEFAAEEIEPGGAEDHHEEEPA